MQYKYLKAANYCSYEHARTQEIRQCSKDTGNLNTRLDSEFKWHQQSEFPHGPMFFGVIRCCP